MRLIGLIPARGGSKSIPGKNLASCGGRPLIDWTCEAALQARSLSRVCVSTDDERIAAHCRELGVEVPFTRPAHLAADDTPSLEVLRHFLGWIEASGEACDAIVLLQPTSPLRTAQHIEAAASMFSSGRWDSLVSLVVAEHRYMPEKLMRVVDGAALPLSGRLGEIVPRQRMESCYARNGPAIVISRAEVLRAGALYGERNAAYVMSRYDSADVDEPEDLLVASALLAYRERLHKEKTH